MLDEFRGEITELINSKTKDKNTHLELESLPSRGWGYDHFPTTVRFARLLGKEILGMTGKLHTYWGDFLGDQLHPIGNLSKASYDLIGKNLPKEEFVMYLGKVDIKLCKSKFLLNTVKPYFNRGEDDKFCSHQHTPSSKDVGMPGLLYIIINYTWHILYLVFIEKMPQDIYTI